MAGETPGISIDNATSDRFHIYHSSRKNVSGYEQIALVDISGDKTFVFRVKLVDEYDPDQDLSLNTISISCFTEDDINDVKDAFPYVNWSHLWLNLAIEPNYEDAIAKAENDVLIVAMTIEEAKLILAQRQSKLSMLKQMNTQLINKVAKDNNT